jgi:hypothetical protein
VNAASQDTVNWAYVFAAFAHFYGWDWRRVMELTPKQTRHYLDMMRYVSEWSRDAGTVPPVPAEYLSRDALAREGERVGLRVPDLKETRHDG